MMARAIAMVMLTALLFACPPAPVPPGPDDTEDAGPNPSCSSYCTHARTIRCKQGDPTVKGGTCETVCTNVQQSGYALLNLRCGYHAKTCAELDACER